MLLKSLSLKSLQFVFVVFALGITFNFAFAQEPLVNADLKLQSTQKSEGKGLCDSTQALDRIRFSLYGVQLKISELQKNAASNVSDYFKFYSSALPLFSEIEHNLVALSSLETNEKMYVEFLNAVQIELDFARYLMRELGNQFGRLGSRYSEVVHGAKAWKPIRVLVQLDEAKLLTRSMNGYLDTFKRQDATKLSFAERAEEFNFRLDKFRKKNGSLENIIHVKEHTILSLDGKDKYDYVIDVFGNMRLYNLDRAKYPKLGHTLLANGGSNFSDMLVLMAGEIWLLKDAKGKIINIYLSNSSGHFLPDYSQLIKLADLLRKFRVPESKIVFFGGPHSYEDIIQDFEKNFQLLIPNTEFSKNSLEMATDLINCQ